MRSMSLIFNYNIYYMTYLINITSDVILCSHVKMGTHIIYSIDLENSFRVYNAICVIDTKRSDTKVDQMIFEKK